MGANKISFLVLCFLCWWSSAACQSVLESYPVFPKTTEQRVKLITLAQSQVGVKELTGNNDGKEVEMYLRSVGLKKGNPYCAAGVSWCHIQLNIPNPESGWSPAWFNNNIVYRKGEPRTLPFKYRGGEVVGFYVPSKGRIGHVGLAKMETKLHVETIEFNTNGMGSSEGQGVHNLIRKKETIYVVSDFVGWKEFLEGVKALKSKK